MESQFDHSSSHRKTKVHYCLLYVPIYSLSESVYFCIPQISPCFTGRCKQGRVSTNVCQWDLSTLRYDDGDCEGKHSRCIRFGNGNCGWYRSFDLKGCYRNRKPTRKNRVRWKKNQPIIQKRLIAENWTFRSNRIGADVVAMATYLVGDGAGCWLWWQQWPGFAIWVDLSYFTNYPGCCNLKELWMIYKSTYQMCVMLDLINKMTLLPSNVILSIPMRIHFLIVILLFLRDIHTISTPHVYHPL